MIFFLLFKVTIVFFLVENVVITLTNIAQRSHYFVEI